jgi:hypothetical protein
VFELVVWTSRWQMPFNVLSCSDLYCIWTTVSRRAGQTLVLLPSPSSAYICWCYPRSICLHCIRFLGVAITWYSSSLCSNLEICMLRREANGLHAVGVVSAAWATGSFRLLYTLRQLSFACECLLMSACSQRVLTPYEDTIQRSACCCRVIPLSSVLLITC